MNNTMNNTMDAAMRERMKRLLVVWEVLTTVLSVSIIILNSLVVSIYFCMGKKKKKIPNYLLFMQASVDFCYGIKLGLDVIPAYNQRHLVRDDSYNTVKVFLGDMVTYIAVGTLIMTSGERYIALHKPLYHLQAVTRFKVMICTFVLIFLAAIPSSVFAILNDLKENFFSNFLIGFYVFDNVFIICGIMFVLTLFILTYRTIHKSFKSKISTAKSNVQMQQISNQQQQQKQQQPTGTRTRGRHISAIRTEHQKNARIIRLFLTIATLYIVTYLPTCIFTIYTKNGGGKSLGYVGLLEMQVSLFALHCAPAVFNPLLTFLLKDDYRYPIKFCKKKWRQFLSDIRSKPNLSRSRFFINGAKRTTTTVASIHGMSKSPTTSTLL